MHEFSIHLAGVSQKSDKVSGNGRLEHILEWSLLSLQNSCNAIDSQEGIA